jgi:hypothetical protein
MVYKDHLIEINELELILFNYYFPGGREKRISFSEIEKIIVYPCTFWTGKWRIWGTGDFRTWFPLDGKRMKRDKVLYMILKKRWVRIGFTVENFDIVYRIFSDKDLIN